MRGVKKALFWEYLSGAVIGSLHVQVEDRANEQAILSQVSEVIGKEIHPSTFAIQLEKSVFEQSPYVSD